MKIGINGFGRLGRSILALRRPVALTWTWWQSMTGAMPSNANLFQFDSTYGPFQSRLKAADGQIAIDGRYNERFIWIVSYLNQPNIIGANSMLNW